MVKVAAESERAITDAAKVVARDVIAPHSVEVDRERRYPSEGLRALAEVGTLGLLAGAAHGGSDGGIKSLTTVCETVGGVCASTGMVYLMHGQGYTSALPIERHVRDSLAGAVMAPTNGVLRTWTGKALSGLPVP